VTVREGSICRFGANRIPQRIKALSKEIDGVRKGDDIEHVHRMRVASRRLRTALPLFKRCFPAGKFRSWKKTIKQITRVLSEARDTDVQITFLSVYARDHPSMDAGNAGIRYLTSYLKERRQEQQSAVLDALLPEPGGDITHRFCHVAAPGDIPTTITSGYLHSEIDTLEWNEIIRDLRRGKFDCLIGINLLREGLDIPEVSLVAILENLHLFHKHNQLMYYFYLTPFQLTFFLQIRDLGQSFNRE
jgi:hypothetical protein